MEAKAIFLIVSRAQTNILFIIEVKILMFRFVKWSYNFSNFIDYRV